MPTLIDISNAIENLEKARQHLREQEEAAAQACRGFDQELQAENERNDQILRELDTQIQQSERVANTAEEVDSRAAAVMEQAESELRDWSEAEKKLMQAVQLGDQINANLDQKIGEIRMQQDSINGKINSFAGMIEANNREIQIIQDTIRRIRSQSEATARSFAYDIERYHMRMRDLNRHNRENCDAIKNLQPEVKALESKEKKLQEHKIVLVEIRGRAEARLSEARQGLNIAQANLAKAQTLKTRTAENKVKAGQSRDDDTSHRAEFESASRNAAQALSEIHAMLNDRHSAISERTDSAASVLNRIIDRLTAYMTMPGRQ